MQPIVQRALPQQLCIRVYFDLETKEMLAGYADPDASYTDADPDAT